MANVPLRPLGVKFFGVFLTPLPAGDSDLSFTTNWDFVNSWKPQIDAAKALGANLIVYFGSIKAVPTGVISLATYLARHRQVIEYIGSLGMYALPYAAYSTYGWIAAMTNAQACSLFASDAAMASQYPHVIGYVTTDEPWESATDKSGTLSDATIVAYAAAQYAAVRAVVPADFPVCTAPNPSIQSSTACFTYSGLQQTRCDSIAPYCDFFAFHPFYTVTLAESAAVRAAYPGKDIIMSSSVLTLDSDTSGEISARAASIMGLVGANGFRGMGHFIAVQFDASTYQLFDYTGTTPIALTERPLKTAAFRANNRAIDVRNHRVMRGKPRLTNLKQIGY